MTKEINKYPFVNSIFSTLSGEHIDFDKYDKRVWIYRAIKCPNTKYTWKNKSVSVEAILIFSGLCSQDQTIDWGLFSVTVRRLSWALTIPSRELARPKDIAATGVPAPTATLLPSVRLTVWEDKSAQTENSTSSWKQCQNPLYLM